MAWTVKQAAAGLRGYDEARNQLPADAKWSCSFGYPGNGGFNEYFRRPNGERWIISNGIFGDEWQCRQA